jgi:hypothetical protein
MIKAAARAADGRHVLLIGLSEENVTRLRAGQPIAFDLDQLQVPKGAEVGHVALFYGATEADCLEALRPLLGDRTDVRINRG